MLRQTWLCASFAQDCGTRVFAHKFKRKHLGGQGAYTKPASWLTALKIASARLQPMGTGAAGPKTDRYSRMNERALNDEEKEDNRKAREGRRNLSWIWYSGGIRDSDVKADGSLHEVEWAKARARAERWREELILLEEEMRRVLEFSEARSDVTPELAEGLRAYALAQAARERAWELDWRNKWAAVRELELEEEEEEEAFEEFDDEELL
ncbi:hypothetical protein B0H14DRAFT_3505058 [Mycena olivaceomarginata]|nr:hypothetical protein B0H14DRAFT_3505058 [Mycena olivaceomarginata]